MLRPHSLKVFVLKALITGNDMSFSELVLFFATTEGNMYHPLESLLEDGYIVKVPNVDRLTIYRITPLGKAAFERYVRQLIE